MKKNILSTLNNLQKKVLDRKSVKTLIFYSDYLKDKLNNKLITKIKLSKIKSFKPKFSLSNITNKLNLLKVLENFQDKIDKLMQYEYNQVVLKQSRFWASAITWTLMGGTAFGFAWIAIAKTDEVVVAVGKLEPKSGVIDVQVPMEGVASEILVKEGQQVEKNQVLMRLDTGITQAKHDALKKNLQINQTILERLRILVKEGAVSEIQFLQQEMRIEDIKSEIQASLITLSYQDIKSPINGYVFELQPKGAGFVARASQPIMRIVPMDSLVANIEIDSRRIGFVETGKKAEISIDSFPATDFGVLKGEIVSIGSDALPPIPMEGKQYRFPAKIKLENQYLELKSGRKLLLQPGMSLTANIKLRKVTYLQLFLNKFGDKAKSLRSI
tara:strand:+ start:4794 stop:5948 length:1155 start_codon:yes stop_codon:yes gene_type:complete